MNEEWENMDADKSVDLKGDVCVPGSKAAWTCRQIPTFQGNTVSPSSGVKSTWRVGTGVAETQK